MDNTPITPITPIAAINRSGNGNIIIAGNNNVVNSDNQILLRIIEQQSKTIEKLLAMLEEKNKPLKDG